MRKLVECVPNFSEGRDRAVIDAIADAIRATAGCTLLDVDPGASTNRTVYTLVGAPEAVVEGALAAARVAREPHRHADAEGRAPARRRDGRLPLRPRVGREDGGLRRPRRGLRPARGRGARRPRLPVRPRGEGRSPPHAPADPGGGVRGARGPDREAGVDARLRPGRVRAAVGSDLRGRARLPDRLQRQRPRDEGASPPHRARRSRAGARARRARSAQGGAGHRVVGRGVRPRPGLDQPRGLQDDAAARGLRGLRGGGAGAEPRAWPARSSWASSPSRRC